MKKSFFEHYEEFYTMTLACAVIGNLPSEEYIADAEKIIEYIGCSYKSDRDFIEYCKSSILSPELLSIATPDDALAMYALSRENHKITNVEPMFNVKCDVLSQLQDMKTSSHHAAVSFDYSQCVSYYPAICFHKIKTAASTGELILTRELGILYVLGIGCKQDVCEGIGRLKQCVYWGDIPSMFMLAYAYRLNEDEANSALLYEVAEISQRYLHTGRTVLPKAFEDIYSDMACRYYEVISSIKQDVINAYERDRIDFSFIEVISDSRLDYYKKMEYINNYNEKKWKEFTHSSIKPLGRIGFM